MPSGILELCFRLKNLLAREDGQDMVEYGLIASMVAVASVAAIRPLAVPINALLATVSSALNSA